MLCNTKADFLNICPKGRLLGIDMGKKNIGIAITDETRTICTPSQILNTENHKKDIENLQKIINEKKIKGLIVGNPLNFNGEDTEMSLYIKKFFEKFVKKYALPVIFWDERLTSYMAEEEIKESIKAYNKKTMKGKIDMVAAVYILESFLK